MNIIAIIPAKKDSERLPNKNILKINGKELWLYSVEYAISEGFTPIVTTDSEHIISECKKIGIDFYEETVNESDICNCINQVLTKYECDYFVLLQPTSPIRQKRLVERVGLPETSIYSCERIKIVGHMDGKLVMSYREQDSSSRFLYHWDGNIAFVNAKWYNNSRRLLCDESEYFIEDIPYSLQIDTKEQFDVIKRLL